MPWALRDQAVGRDDHARRVTGFGAGGRAVNLYAPLLGRGDGVGEDIAGRGLRRHAESSLRQMPIATAAAPRHLV